MKLDQLISTIKVLQDQLDSLSPQFENNPDKRILARTVKVSEEFGEFADEILGSLDLQKSNKLEEFNREDLEKEFADTLLTLFLLGLTLDIDISEVIKKRIKAKQKEFSRELEKSR